MKLLHQDKKVRQEKNGTHKARGKVFLLDRGHPL